MKSKNSLVNKDQRDWNYLSASGILVLFILILIIIFVLVLSFFEKIPFVNQYDFVFLKNYFAVFQDPQFYQSLSTGFTYAIVTTIFQIIIGLFAANYLKRFFLFRKLFVNIFFLPYLIPSVVVFVVWSFLLNYHLGIINHYLNLIGIGSINWYSSNNILLTIIILSIWQFFPFTLFVIYAKLHSIPTHLYETAASDGATKINQFLFITIPQLKITLISLFILRFIIMLMKFDIPWLLISSTGAGRKFNTPSTYIYRQVFEQLNIGKGFTVSLIFVLILSLFVYISHKITMSNE